MRIVTVILCFAFLLTGCATDVFETVGDSVDVEVMAEPATLLMELPHSAASPVMEGASGTLYFCDGYEIMVETIQTLTGFSREDVQLVETKRSGVACYEAVWSAAGEAGDQVGRVMVLDDGMYHYCISFLTAADDAADCAAEWQSVLDSVGLAES